MKKISFFVVLFLTLCNNVLANPTTQSSHYGLIMENHANNDTYISFQNDIGRVYFDIPLEDNTLLRAQDVSEIYGVNYAPNDPRSTFKIIFKNEKECQFTIGYFTPPENPRVTMTGNGCDKAGYRMDYTSYATLILYIG